MDRSMETTLVGGGAVRTDKPKVSQPFNIASSSTLRSGFGSFLDHNIIGLSQKPSSTL